MAQQAELDEHKSTVQEQKDEIKRLNNEISILVAQKADTTLYDCHQDNYSVKNN